MSFTIIKFTHSLCEGNHRIIDAWIKDSSGKDRRFTAVIKGGIARDHLACEEELKLRLEHWHFRGDI